ncbi:hypothetical protein C8R44DRAFT_733336 [Mycena epipterygia]|nr:hypothetical protein C8R44DRAFT_733336 [Mycena epipterygia]
MTRFSMLLSLEESILTKIVPDPQILIAPTVSAQWLTATCMKVKKRKWLTSEIHRISTLNHHNSHFPPSFSSTLVPTSLPRPHPRTPFDTVTMAPFPAMNRYEKMVKDAERAYTAASAAVAAEATASIPVDYSPPNWRIMLGILIGLQIAVDVESTTPEVVFVPPVLKPPLRAATHFIGPPVSYRGYISQADLLKGKTRQDGFV